MSEEKVTLESHGITIETRKEDEEHQNFRQGLQREQDRLVSEEKKEGKTVSQQQSETQTATTVARSGILDIRGSRNDSVDLLNENSKKDSPEMQEVKRAVRELEVRLKGVYNDKGTFDELERLYNSAISSCQSYVSKKNPRFSTGKKRKTMVEKVKNNLIMELALLQEEIKCAAQNGLFLHSGMPCYDILDVTKVMLPEDDEAKALLIGKQAQFDQMTRVGNEDSPEMEKVKTANADLFRLLYETRTSLGDADTLTDMVKVEFATVISACDDYIGAKAQNPKTKEGRFRLAAVKELRSRYQKEQQHIGGAIKALKSKGEDVSLASAYKRINGDKDIFAFDILEMGATESETRDTVKTSDVSIEMTTIKSETEKKKEVLDQRVRDMRLETLSYDVAPPADWVQDENQSYFNSCWAVSSMNLVNCFNTRHNPGKPRVKQTFVLNLDGKNAIRYNEALKTGVYGNSMDEYFDEEKRNVERFRSSPNTHMGNVRSVSDMLLAATDGQAIVRSKRFNVFINPSLPGFVQSQRTEVIKLEMIKAVHEALTVHQSPVSVLAGGHYLTIVGINGRNFICKNSLGNTPEDYNDTISVDRVFSSNQRNRLVEFVWLQKLDQEALDGIAREFPDAQEIYDARKHDRIEAKGYLSESEYTHVDGCDISRIDTDEALETNEIQTTAYVPKNLTGGLVFPGSTD